MTIAKNAHPAIGSVTLIVQNIERMLAFYKDILGFHVYEKSEMIPKNFTAMGLALIQSSGMVARRCSYLGESIITISA